MVLIVFFLQVFSITVLREYLSTATLRGR